MKIGNMNIRETTEYEKNSMYMNDILKKITIEHILDSPIDGAAT